MLSRSGIPEVWLGR